ncbi:MAG: hypothetical protein ABW250_00355 [Pyrinomonadaceae bacterium]
MENVTLEQHENLTFAQRAVVNREGLDSLPGHVVVVFEKLDKGGAAFSRLINPGERFQKSGFRLWDTSHKYFSVAVNKAFLSYSFERPVTLDDEIHTFTLKFHLKYRAADPQLVAELRDQDPLRMLRDEISLVVGRSCAQRKWEMVRDRFRELEVVVMNSERAKLRQYAATLGLEIFSIELDKRLPSDVIAIPQAQEKAEAEKRKFQIEQEVKDTKEEIVRTRAHLRRLEDIERQHVERDRELSKQYELTDREDAIRRVGQQRDLNEVGHQKVMREAELDGQIELREKEDAAHNAARMRKLQEARDEAIATALRNVGAGIGSPAELLEGAQVAQQISMGVQSNGGQSPLPTGLPGAAVGILGAGEDGLSGLVNQVISESERLNCTFAQKQAVRSAALHLVAEVLLDDRADEKVLKQYAEKLSEIGSSLQLSTTQLRFFQKLRDYERLREYLG